MAARIQSVRRRHQLMTSAALAMTPAVLTPVTFAPCDGAVTER